MKGISEIRIRGYHADAYGHVNNARYLEFLEEGRWKVFEDCMDITRILRGEFYFFVVNININYRKGLQVNDTARIETRLKKTGSKSAVLHQRVTEAGSGAVCAEADVTFVIANDKGALPMEGDVLEFLSPLPRLEAA